MPKLYLTYPHSLAAIRIFLQRVVKRHKSCRSVVVRDAPFYTAGDPRAEHSYKGRLDYVLAIKKIIVVGFV
ncbi:hypothetical protein ES703_77403 [subsurface metagenome]